MNSSQKIIEQIKGVLEGKEYTARRYYCDNLSFKSFRKKDKLISIENDDGLSITDTYGVCCFSAKAEVEVKETQIKIIDTINNRKTMTIFSVDGVFLL